MTQPRVAIVILNWNGWNDTVELIESIQRIRYAAYRIVVVDNHSDHQEGQRLKQRYGDTIEVICNSNNLGYAGGNNAAHPSLSNGAYDFVAIVNNDVIVQPDFLDPLVAAFEADPALGLACPVILDYQKRDSIQSAGGLVNVPTGTVRLLHYLPIRPYVDFAPGACFLIRTDLWRKLGGFDEQFFAYWEEVDLALRARQAGYRCGVVSNSSVYHKTASSTRYLSKTYVYYMLRNQLFFMRKHCPRIFRPLSLAFFLFRNVFAYLILSIIRRSPGFRAIPRAIIHGLFKPLITIDVP